MSPAVDGHQQAVVNTLIDISVAAVVHSSSRVDMVAGSTVFWSPSHKGKNNNTDMLPAQLVIPF